MSDFFDDFDDSDETPVPDIDSGAARREASREALGIDSISGIAGTDFTDPSALDFDNPQAVHQQTVDRNWMIKVREDFAEQSVETWRRVREEGDFSDAAIPEAFSRTVEETRNALLQDLPLDKDGEVLVSDDARRRLEGQLSTMASGYHDLGRQRHNTATKAKGLDLMARSAAMAAATATTAPFAVRGAMDNVRSDVEAYEGVFDRDLIEHNVHAGQVQVLRGAIDGYVTQGMGDTARQLLTGDKFNDVLTDEDKTALQTHIDRTERRRDIEDEAAQNARRADAETAMLDGLAQGTLTNTDIDRIDGLPDDGPGSRATFHTILDRRDAGLLENGTDPTLHTDPKAYGDFLSAALEGGITTADLIDRIGDGVSIEDATLLAGLSESARGAGHGDRIRLMKAAAQQTAQHQTASTPSLDKSSSRPAEEPGSPLKLSLHDDNPENSENIENNDEEANAKIIFEIAVAVGKRILQNIRKSGGGGGRLQKARTNEQHDQIKRTLAEEGARIAIEKAKETLDKKAEIEISDFGPNATAEDAIIGFAQAERDGLTAKLGGKDAKLSLGEIPDSVADKIMQEHGIDVKGFRSIVELKRVTHAFNIHGPGNEKDKNQEPISVESLGALTEVVKNPDSIEFRTRKKGGSKVLTFKKRINGTFVYIEQVRSKNKELGFTTMYIRKAGVN